MALFKGLKPGMREEMNENGDNMQANLQHMAKLGQEHIASLPADAQEAKRKEWEESLEVFWDVHQDDRKINEHLQPDA